MKGVDMVRRASSAARIVARPGSWLTLVALLVAVVRLRLRAFGVLVERFRTRSDLGWVLLVALASAFVLMLAAGGVQRADASDYHGTITPGGSAVAVALSNSGDNGYLTWSGSTGDRVFVKASTGSLSGAGSHVVYVSILKPNGSQLATTQVFGSSSVSFIDTQSLPSTGTYTVFVDPYQDTTGTTTVTLYSVPADASGSITPGGSSVGVTVSTAGQNGALTWSGSTGDRVFVKASTGSLSGAGSHVVYVSILKPDGSQLATTQVFGSSSVSFIDTQSLPSTGTYTVFVDPYQDTTGTTTVTLYSVPADASGSITPGGSSVGVTVSTAGQNGALTWSGSTGDRVFVKASTGSLSGAGSHVVYVSILKPDGSQLATTQVFGSSSVSFIDTQSLPSTGTYTVFVDPYQDTTGTTTVTLYSVPADASGSITDDGPSVPVATATPGQNGALTFAGTTGQQVNLAASTGSLSGAGSHVVSVSILKPNGSQLATTQVFGSNSSASTGSQTLPTTGTYTVKVDPYQDTTGTTTLTLETGFVSGEVPAPAAALFGGSSDASPGLCNCHGNIADPVNAGTGDFSDTWTDASLRSFGPAVAFSRTYDSSLAQAQATAGTPGALGYGWTDNWNMSLSVSSGIVTITQADGAQVEF